MIFLKLALAQVYTWISVGEKRGAGARLSRLLLPTTRRPNNDQTSLLRRSISRLVPVKVKTRC
jgi:hypothetical protein